jgi:hypothetical protein
MQIKQESLPSGTALLLRHGELELHPVDAVDAVNEQDEDEDERDLSCVSIPTPSDCLDPNFHTFIPYCSLATNGLLEMNSKSPRLILKGMGMMRERKRSISKTRSPKTWFRRVSMLFEVLHVALSADRCVDQTHDGCSIA